MLDPVIDFFRSLFAAIGYGLGVLVSWIVWPFVAFWGWLGGRGWVLKIPVFAILASLVGGYGYLFYITQFWWDDDPDYVAAYNFADIPMAAGIRRDDGTCQPSAMVQMTADLIDRNVNENVWVPSNPLEKAGFFFIMDWRDTPFFDNKAAFQLGINQAVRRTAVEFVDRLGRVRGTSAVNINLQQAREAANYREDAWFVTFTPPFLQPSTQSRLRDARVHLTDFNRNLTACDAEFDARADNLLQFVDRVTADLGATSEILQRRIEMANFTGFDVRADDRFWFTYGQLYAYYGILSAARADFQDVFDQRNLDNLWVLIDQQFVEALKIRPPFVANGSVSSPIKSHLESIGFALLRVRSNLVEMRDILDR